MSRVTLSFYKTIPYVILTLFLSMSLSHTVFAANQKLTFVGGKKADSPAVKFLMLLYTEAFGKLDYAIEYIHLPGKRASKRSDTGEADGELSRSFTYGVTHPNVIQVEEEHYRSGFYALSLDPAIRLNGWESLRNTPYNIGYRRGPKVASDNIPPMVEINRINVVNSITSGLMMLQKGRIDVYIDSESDLLFGMDDPEFKDVDFNLAGRMNSFSSHLYLHKKHRHILEDLNAILLDMRHKGYYEVYRLDAGFLSIIRGN